MEHILSKRFRLATDGLERLVTPTFAKKRHGHHRPEDYPGDHLLDRPVYLGHTAGT